MGWGCSEYFTCFRTRDHLIGLVVKAAQDPGFESHLHLTLHWLTMPGTWHYTIFIGSVLAGTGWPGVTILSLGEMESLICNFYLSVAAHTIGRSIPENEIH